MSEDEIVEFLRAQGHRVTIPRRLLIRSLLEADDHRTVDELALDVQRQAPDVHISTIYRNLEELERLGVIVHSHLGHGASTYHLSTVTHGHLLCEECGKTIEIPQELFAPLVRRVRNEYQFAIDLHHFAMVGRCGECAEKKTPSTAGALV
ncbi:MAG TPA: Fur family transcriptional regulator [Acidimicrobiales bacterium]|nr:Fur family transcriptional regulator [Acidimicrobiales bacterium]